MSNMNFSETSRCGKMQKLEKMGKFIGEAAYCLRPKSAYRLCEVGVSSTSQVSISSMQSWRIVHVHFSMSAHRLCEVGVSSTPSF